MSERSFRVRAEDDRNEHALTDRVLIDHWIHARLEDRSSPRFKICFRDSASVDVLLEDRIAFVQQACGLIDLTRRMRAINHVQTRSRIGLRIFSRRDVNERAGSDHRAQDRVIEKRVPVVEIVDLIDVEIVIPELPEDETVGKAVTRFRAPAERGVHPAQARRRADLKVCRDVFHFVVVVPIPDAERLDREFFPEIFHPLQFCWHFIALLMILI